MSLKSISYLARKKYNKKDSVPKMWGRMSQMPGVLDLVENYDEARERSEQVIHFLP